MLEAGGKAATLFVASEAQLAETLDRSFKHFVLVLRGENKGSNCVVSGGFRESVEIDVLVVR